MNNHEIGDIVRITNENYDKKWRDQSLVIFEQSKPNNDDLQKGLIYMKLYKLKTIDKKDVPFMVYGHEIESVNLWYTPKK